MFDNQYFKTEGKRKFKQNYWMCVLVSAILAFLGNGSGIDIDFDFDDIYNTITNAKNSQSVVNSVTGSFLPDAVAKVVNKMLEFLHLNRMSAIMLFVAFVVVAIVLAIFVFNIIEVGGARFYIMNAEEPEEKARVGELVQPFLSENYMEIVKTQFLRGLYTLLWSLLLIIPGIVKSFEYTMIPYIMADYPEITSDEAFAMSKKMMDGNKANLFILDLTFIGWAILAAVTMGIVGIFFVSPYMDATHAEVYRRLKEARIEQPENGEYWA